MSRSVCVALGSSALYLATVCGGSTMLDEPNSRNSYISCRWVTTDGSRTVPASLLSGLAPGRTSFFVRIEGPPVGVLSGDWAFSASATMDVALFALTLR
jgi:hypothetical protein